MRNCLAIALAALLAAGSAAPAAAASQIDFSGFYKVFYHIQANPKYAAEPQALTDSFFGEQFNLDVSFSPTDEISVYWRIRSPHWERWGSDSRGGSSLISRHIYGAIKKDWGTVYVGRLQEEFDMWGLANLGGLVGLGYWTLMDAFGDYSPLDGIRYVKRWDNDFQLMAQYTRLAENYNGNKDADAADNRFQAELAYFWDGGAASLGGIYERGASDRLSSANNAWYINPAFMHSWGDLSFHFEGKAGWSYQDNYAGSNQKLEGDGYAAYLDLNYNYGPGSVILAGWWASGADSADKDAAIVGMGWNFFPLTAAYGYNAGIDGLTDANGRDLSASRAIDNVVTRANNMWAPAAAGGKFTVAKNDPVGNHWGVVLGGQHSFSEAVTMSYAVGYLALNEATWRNNDSGVEQDKEIGFETDLGFTFELLDNLLFNTTFGYLFTGDALKDPITLNEAEDTYLWINTLQINFLDRGQSLAYKLKRPPGNRRLF